MHARGSRRVEAAQQAMCESGPARFSVPQARAQGFIPLRTGREAIHESAQIETRPAGHDGEVTASGDVLERAAADSCEIARCEQPVGIRDVDQVMRNSAAFGLWQLGGADVKIAEDLHRVAVDDLAIQFPGKLKGQLALAATGRTGDSQNILPQRVLFRERHPIQARTPLTAGQASCGMYHSTDHFSAGVKSWSAKSVIRYTMLIIRGVSLSRARHTERQEMIGPSNFLYPPTTARRPVRFFLQNTTLRALSTFGLMCLLAASGFAQAPPAQTASATPDKATAYYNFSMAHLYAELAGAYGNRGEYVNKAIDFYQAAIKADPSSSYISEELCEFYVQAGQVEKALALANSLLKANPANNDARKILARIYTRGIGDPDQGKVDQTMLKDAIDQYQRITQQDPKDTESLSMLARLYRVSHDETNAEKTYRQVLATDPNDEDALNGLAMVYADRGDLPNAIDMLKQAVDKNPDPRMVIMLAEFYEQVKDYSHAADTMKLALEAGDNVRVRQALAVDLLEANRLDEALAAFQQLANDDPRNFKLQIQIAEILERKHDFDGAAAAIAKAKAVDNSTQVRFAEAQLLRIENKNAQAIAAMQAIVADTKKDQYTDAEKKDRIGILNALGTMQSDAGKTMDAVASFRQIADLDPQLTPSVEGKIVETYKAGKEYKLARQEADAALKKFPSDRAVVLEHALLLGDLGLTDTALGELKAMANYAKDRDILIGIGQVQDKAKRFDDERKTLDAADALSSNPGDKQAIEFYRGAMYEREKNYEAAEKSFRNVLEGDPENAGALNYLGYMFAERNVNLEEAEKLIEKALDLDPGNGAFEDSLGWVYYRENKLEQAAEILRTAVDKTGKDPTVHDHLAEVYFKQGKIREAIQQWEASMAEWKTAIAADQDPVESGKVAKKLENAKVRVAEKAPAAR